MECVIPEDNLSPTERFCSNRDPFRMSVPGEYISLPSPGNFQGFLTFIFIHILIIHLQFKTAR